MKAFPTVDRKRGDVPSSERSSEEKSSEPAKHQKLSRASTLRMVIESLETRAMLAGVGPESWSAPGIAPAPLGSGRPLPVIYRRDVTRTPKKLDGDEIGYLVGKVAEIKRRAR